ncbi:MAG: MBL fold metallo-hydrolase [Desulfomonilaceae bacterium]
MKIELISLTENLCLILGVRKGHFPMSHSFLVQDEISALIDTGSGLDLLSEIKEKFQIDMVINSHGHPDHSAGNFLFPDQPLYVPKMGANTHGRLELLSKRFFPNEVQAAKWRKWIKQAMGFEDREPTDVFDNGHIFDFGRTRLLAIHTPGHTEDHFCLLELGSGILLAFDIDLTSFGPWYGNLESNLKDFRVAIEKVRQIKARAIASSHRLPVLKNIEEHLNKYESFFDKRNQLLLELIKGGASRSEILLAKPIYRRHPFARDVLPLFEARMVDLHLDEMIELGLIRLDGEKLLPV